jgi:hypothetical protein
MTTYKNQGDHDKELKQAGLVLDRAKPAPKGRELNAEAIGDDNGKMNQAQIRRVGRK